MNFDLNENQIREFEKKFYAAKEKILLSKIFEETIFILNNEWKHKVEIRCLALGQIFRSQKSMYQLAYLTCIAENYSIKNISVYDPAFEEPEIIYMENVLKFRNEKNFKPNLREEINTCLYFLPHAPIDVVSEIFLTEKPNFFLSNDLHVQTKSFTDNQLFTSYPIIFEMLKVEKNFKQGVRNESCEFVIVKKNKKKRKNKKIEALVVNNNQSDKICYFDSLEIYTFNEQNISYNMWNGSFSDLAFHRLEKKG